VEADFFRFSNKHSLHFILHVPSTQDSRFLSLPLRLRTLSLAPILSNTRSCVTRTIILSGLVLLRLNPLGIIHSNTLLLSRTSHSHILISTSSHILISSSPHLLIFSYSHILIYSPPTTYYSQLHLHPFHSLQSSLQSSQNQLSSKD
jgi:hypothetical protein